MLTLNYLFESENSPQLGYDDLDKFISLNKNKEIFWSYKVDGARCFVIVNKRTIPYNGGFKKIADIKYISRNNKVFNNLHIFDNNIIELCHHINRISKIKYPIIFDCEIASKTRNLSDLMTQLRRQNNVNSNIFTLYIFDLAINDMKFSDRKIILEKAFDNNLLSNIKLLEYKKLDDISNIDNLKTLAVKSGYEGIMLMSGDNLYKFNKRSRDICKVKDIKTIDLKIVGFNIGSDNTKFANKISTFICQYNNSTINISGKLDNNTREYLVKNPPIGQYAEIKYSEITNNGQLRHPIFVRLRPDK